MHQLNVANDNGVNVNSYTDRDLYNSQCMIEMQTRDNENEPHASSKLTFSIYLLCKRLNNEKEKGSDTARSLYLRIDSWLLSIPDRSDL